MSPSIVAFIGAMWVLLVAGGGVVVLALGPVSVSGFGEWDAIITSGFKAVIAVALVVAWIVILSKLKKGIFRKQLGF